MAVGSIVLCSYAPPALLPVCSASHMLVRTCAGDRPVKLNMPIWLVTKDQSFSGHLASRDLHRSHMKRESVKGMCSP